MRHQLRARRYLAAVLLPVLLAACASSTTGATGGTGKESSNNKVAVAKALVAKSEAVPGFVAPGPAFNASQARGKSIFWIASSTNNAFENNITSSIAKAAADLGINFFSYPNGGQVSQYVSGMQLAIQRHPDVIILNAVNPALIVPQIQAARQAGIDVVASLQPNLQTFSSGTLPGVPDAYKLLNAVVYAPFIRTARLEADYVVAASHGHADVLLLTSNNVIESFGIVAAIKQEISRMCGGGCKVSTADVPTTQWATNLENQTQASLTADPGVNYIIPLYDSMASFVLPGVLAAGRGSSVKIVTFNGTVSVLTQMEKSPVIAADVAINPEELGLLDLDQTMRLLLGLPTDRVVPAAVRTFTQQNIKEAGTPPQPGSGYGEKVLDGFAHLWKLNSAVGL